MVGEYVENLKQILKLEMRKLTVIELVVTEVVFRTTE